MFAKKYIPRRLQIYDLSPSLNKKELQGGWGGREGWGETES